MFPGVAPYWNKAFHKTAPEGIGPTPGTPAASTAYLFSEICYSVTAGLSQVKSFKCPILYLSRLAHHEQMSSAQNLEAYSDISKGEPSSVCNPVKQGSYGSWFSGSFSLRNDNKQSLVMNALGIPPCQFKFNTLQSSKQKLHRRILQFATRDHISTSVCFLGYFKVLVIAQVGHSGQKGSDHQKQFHVGV